MKSTTGFMAVLKEFAKEIRAPEILVANTHPYHKSKWVKALCNKIGATVVVHTKMSPSV